MDLSRRNFLKLSGASLASLALGLGFDPDLAQAQGYALKIEGTKKFRAFVIFVPEGAACFSISKMKSWCI